MPFCSMAESTHDQVVGSTVKMHGRVVDPAVRCHGGTMIVRPIVSTDTTGPGWKTFSRDSIFYFFAATSPKFSFSFCIAISDSCRTNLSPQTPKIFSRRSASQV